MIKLFDAGGDLTQKWFLYWEEKGRQHRYYRGINRYNTEAERRMAAERAKEMIISKPNAENKAYLNEVLLWIENRAHVYRLSTVKGYRSKVKHLFAWLGKRKLSKANLDAFFEMLLSKKLSSSTYNSYITQLRYLFAEVLKQGELFKGIRRLPKTSQPAVFFTKQQIRHISKNMAEQDPELWLACQFIFYCFIRPGELRMLKVSDIDFDQMQIVIRREVSKNKKEQWVKIPKAFTDIDKLLDRDPTEFVLGGKQQVGTNTLKNRHQKLIKALGFDTKRFKLYSWKHTGAVMAAKSGIGVKQLQMQLRHHSLDEVNGYLRQMGIADLDDLAEHFPKI